MDFRLLRLCRRNRLRAFAMSSTSYDKAYYLANKERIREYQREYRKKNAARIKENYQRHWDAHKEKILERSRVWRNENLERKKQSDREWYLKNTQLVVDRSWAFTLKKRYGITPEYYAELDVSQDGKCKVCGLVPNKKLSVDHCHTTNKVRGLLCQPCNMAIGLLKDDVQIIQSLLDYLSASKC